MSNTTPVILQAIREYQQRAETVIVPEAKRPGTLARVWGAADCLNVENVVFNVARRILPAYPGGYWDFLKLANGGFYMALDAERTHRVSVDGNGFEGEVSGDAAGLIVCMTTYSVMSFEAADRLQAKLVHNFHWLRDYAGEHPEASAIFAAID